MKKGLIYLCLVLIIGIFLFFGFSKYKNYHTAFDMSTDEDNKIITGIWEDDLERYKYIVIPSVDFKAKTIGRVKYPYSEVTDIGENAFQDHTYIKSVYIPVNIIRIRSNAFKGCTSIQSVYYAGTEQQWKNVVIESGNDAITSKKIKYNATMPRTGD